MLRIYAGAGDAEFIKSTVTEKKTTKTQFLRSRLMFYSGRGNKHISVTIS
jgi:hypothetical protein